MNKEDLKKLTDQLEQITKDDENPINAVIKLLSIDDENFNILASPILESFKRSLNNPNDRLTITQAFNASGAKKEDLISEINQFFKELENMKNISTNKKNFLKEIMLSVIQAIEETEGISKRLIPIPIELCHPDAKIPQYAHIEDAGMDVFSLDEYIIKPGETKLIPTGIKMAIPPGYMINVYPKSGISLNTKLRIANSPGTIDSGYRQEIKIIVENVSSPISDLEVSYGEDECDIDINSILFGKDCIIGKGQKFCQLVLQEVPKAALYQVDNVLEIDSNDRGGGFGSTGLKYNE